MRKRGWVAVCALLFVLIGAFQVATIRRTPFFGDESQWLAYARGWFRLTSGQFYDPLWMWVPLDQPMFVPYVFGAIAQASGGEHLLNEIYNFSKDEAANRQEGRIPGDLLLYRCRLASTLLTVLGCGAAMLIGIRLIGPVGALAGVLLGLNPLIVQSGHRAMAEGASTFWILLGWLLCSLLMEAVRRCDHRKAWLWTLLLGLVGGFGAMTKLSGGIILASTVVCGLLAAWTLWRGPRLMEDQPRAWLLPLQMTGVALLVGYLVFVAQSPATWREPLGWPVAMLRERARAAGEQQQLYPRDAITDIPTRLAKVAGRVGGEFGTIGQAGTWPKRLYPDGLLGLAGLAILGRACWRTPRAGQPIGRGEARVAMVWIVALSLPVLLALPLDWDRYYLPVVLAAGIAEAVAVGVIVGGLVGGRAVRCP